MSDRADIVIVGAGPAGSATAIHLARAGHQVTLLDRARFPREKPCSEYLSPETVRHLATLGVLDTLDACGGTALEGTRVQAARGATLVGRFAEAGGTPYRSTGLAMPRRVLDATLLDAARAAGVPLAVNRAGSLLTPFFTAGPVTGYAGAMAADTERFGAFFRAMLDAGVYLPPSQFEAWFVSTAHGDAEIEATVTAARRAFATGA